MARVALDPHIFGEIWFNEVKSELIMNNNVRFSFSGLPQEGLEMSRRRDILAFYKQVGALRRRDDAHKETAERNHGNLAANTHWIQNRRVCDDPHIFALVKSLPTRYVFTRDLRLVQCRDCLNGRVDADYLRFAAITTKESYKSNRVGILGP